MSERDRNSFIVSPELGWHAHSLVLYNMGLKDVQEPNIVFMYSKHNCLRSGTNLALVVPLHSSQKYSDSHCDCYGSMEPSVNPGQTVAFSSNFEVPF